MKKFSVPMTINQYLLLEEKKHKPTRGRFTLLMTQIQDCCKIIAAYIRTAGLRDILGYTQESNVSGDQVAHLDRFTNEVFSSSFKKSDLIYAFLSEEEDSITYVNKDSDYILAVDPLDGSKQSQVDLPSGTIFAIYKKSKGNKLNLSNLVCAGYCLYSSSTTLTYATTDSVVNFTLDQATGNFLLTRKNWQIPKESKEYSTNEAYYQKLYEADQRYLNYTKENGYSLRYVGTLIADMHRIFLDGGIFLYPENKKHTNGKLRIAFETLPFSFITKKLGGEYLAQKEEIELRDSEIHKKSGFAAGSKKEVEIYKSYKFKK